MNTTRTELMNAVCQICRSLTVGYILSHVCIYSRPTGFSSSRKSISHTILIIRAKTLSISCRKLGFLLLTSALHLVVHCISQHFTNIVRLIVYKVLRVFSCIYCLSLTCATRALLFNVVVVLLLVRRQINVTINRNKLTQTYLFVVENLLSYDERKFARRHWQIHNPPYARH